MAQAAMQFPVRRQTDDVLHEDGVFRILAHQAHGALHARRHLDDLRAVDIAHACPVVHVQACAVLAAEGRDAGREVMAQATRGELALDHGLRAQRFFRLAQAAVVVHVIVAIAAKTRVQVLSAAAVREGRIVVALERVLVGRQGGVPVVIERVLEAQAEIAGDGFHGARPRLPVEHGVGADAGRQGFIVQQLEAGRRRLRLVLVVGIELQQRLRGNLPVEGAGNELAVAVGALDVGAQAFGCHVDPVAEARVFQAAAQVDGAVQGAPLARFHGDRAQRRASRALDDEVDHAARCGHACLQAGQALQHFDAFLVFQRNLRVAGNGHAILAVAGIGVELEAADGELFRIADGVVGIVDAGIELDGVAEIADL